MGLTETGSDELAAALAGIAGGLADLTPDVDPVVARARRTAPVLTGQLARSIRATGRDGKATVGTPLRYGLPVHFGVPSHNQRPRPFLFQAVDAETRQIETAYRADVVALIEKKV